MVKYKNEVMRRALVDDVFSCLLQGSWGSRKNWRIMIMIAGEMLSVRPSHELQKLKLNQSVGAGKAPSAK